jgi:hypothetical protein
MDRPMVGSEIAMGGVGRLRCLDIAYDVDEAIDPTPGVTTMATGAGSSTDSPYSRECHERG